MVKGVNLEGLRALGSPRDFIEYYYNNFADELIYHDVVASLYLRNNLRELLKKTSKNIFIPIIAGGGIRSEKDVQELISSGADRIFINSSADWGKSDPLSVPKTALQMENEGFSEDEIKKLLYDNPNNFFKKSKNYDDN